MQYLQKSTKQEAIQLQRNWQLFHIMWRKEAVPQEFKDATIIHLFKRKGNPQVCDNHRGISLLSIVGKILAGPTESIEWKGFYQKASVDSWKTEEQ